jgi:N6-adenosine-specific RNA methylase IME4
VDLELDFTETAIDTDRLAELEHVIERGLNTFVDVGNALMEIRDGRLYKNSHATFEDYCRDKWGMSRFYAHRLIDAAIVTTNLLPIGNIIPQTESQARPLTILSPSEQPAVWQQAVETAPDGKVTAEHVQAMVNLYREQQREKREVRRAEIVQTLTTPKPPTTKSHVILVDPPWKYEFSSTNTRAIENHYPTMTAEELQQFDIESYSENDCVMFMWATSPKLAEAIDLLRQWDFSYRTSMVWVKDKIGMGYYARQRHEILLIATRGNLPIPEPSNRPDSVIEASRTEHSKKPEIVYDIIEQMYPEFSKIEIFARNERDGWSSWGNQL